MYSSSRAHTALSPHPISRGPTAAIIGEEATSSQRPRRSPKDTYHANGPLVHEQGEWPRSRRKFWIYESPPSSSSQDGRSNASSRGNSTESEESEERRARTVSPYGSFFAEEMEFDAPTEGLSFYGRIGQENAAVYTDMNGVFHPTRSWTSSQTQVAPSPGLVHFVTSPEYPTYARPPPGPGPVPVPIHDATGTVRRVPLSQSSLAENSRRSQPPTSWRQGYHHLDRSNDSPHWQNSRWVSPQAQFVTASSSGRSLSSRHDERQTRRVDHGRRRR
jgi:hypothetical protein